MAHTKAIGRSGMPHAAASAGTLSDVRRQIGTGRMGRGPGGPWLTGRMVKYFAGGWTVQELAAIEQELDRQGIRYTIDGDDLRLQDAHAERQVDMIVESITET